MGLALRSQMRALVQTSGCVMDGRHEFWAFRSVC